MIQPSLIDTLLEIAGIRASRSEVPSVLSVNMLFVFFCSRLVSRMSCLLCVLIAVILYHSPQSCIHTFKGYKVGGASG